MFTRSLAAALAVSFAFSPAFAAPPVDAARALEPAVGVALGTAPTAPSRQGPTRDLPRQLRFRRFAARADDATMTLAAYLRVTAPILTGIKLRGNATAEYWMAIAVDMAVVGRGVGAVIEAHSSAYDELPLGLRIALKRQLTKLRTMQAGGTGDVNYWLAMANAKHDQLEAAQEALELLADRIEVEAPEVTVSTPQAFFGATLLVDLIPVTGTGYAEFWMRTCYDLVENAHAVADAIDELAADFPEDLVELITEETDAIRDLDVQGVGGPAYWMSYANELDGELEAGEEVLKEIAAELTGLVQ